jgi:hypothetical protein
VSQAVRAGGWNMTSGGCSSRKDDDVWWYGSSRCWYPSVRASYTWAGAHNFSRFVQASGRGSSAARVADLDIGDVLHRVLRYPHRPQHGRDRQAEQGPAVQLSHLRPPR